MPAALVCAVVILTVSCPVKCDDQLDWKDTADTTALWKAISSGDVEELEAILEDEPDLAHIRASDGRGPLWWAYEHGVEEILDLLKEYDIDEEAVDRDGMKARDMAKQTAGTPTNWAVENAKKEQEEAMRRATASAPTDIDAQIQQMYQMFGVSPFCTDDELRTAYLQLQRRWQPENLEEGADEEQAQQALQYLSQAYNTLIQHRAEEQAADEDFEDDDWEEDDDELDDHDEV